MTDGPLKAGRREKAQGVGHKNGFRTAQEVIHRRRQGCGHGGQGPEHTGHGVGLAEVPLGNQAGVKAVVSHNIHAVDGPREDAPSQQDSVVHPLHTQQEEKNEIEPGGQIVQGVDHPFPAHPVQIGPGQKGHDQHGQLVADIKKHVEEGGPGVVKHHQADTKAGHGVSHHGNQAADGDDCEVVGPQLVRRLFCHKTLLLY